MIKDKYTLAKAASLMQLTLDEQMKCNFSAHETAEVYFNKCFIVLRGNK